MLSGDDHLVPFMEVVVVPVEVLSVGRVMAADVDRARAVTVAVSALSVFKVFVAVIVPRGGDVVLE